MIDGGNVRLTQSYILTVPGSRQRKAYPLNPGVDSIRSTSVSPPSSDTFTQQLWGSTALWDLPALEGSKMQQILS